ncbi:hypothetical protein GQ457_01G033210 [Hibiscus cannabinus]
MTPSLFRSAFPATILFGCSRMLGCGFLSFRVSPLRSQAPLKLAPVRRAHPSKAIWCLVFAVNNGALGAVTKHPILNPISIQVYDVHSQPSSFARTTAISLASMSALHLLFILSFL